jgi:type IV pilus assembly protein PilC
MLSQPRLSTKALAELCHRLAIETEAGIDIRRTWQREANSVRGRLRPYFARIRDAVARGDSLSHALAATGKVFPPLFLELAHVGEETGSLGRVMQRLEQHYRRHVQARRTFLVAIAWPMIELALVVFAIGILILVMGVVGERSGQSFDMLGFGLTGPRGLLIYVTVLMAVALGALTLIYAARRGAFWTRPLQRMLIWLPGIGACLQKLAMSRLAWALHLMMNVEMDLRRVLPLALRATGNDYYMRHSPGVVASIKGGKSIAEALAATKAFPASFTDALAVAEDSGQTVESMGRLADQYEQEAEAAVKVLAVLAGVGVFLFVASVIIWLIFRLFDSYLGAINDAINQIQ